MLTQLIRTFETPRTKALLVFWGIPTTLLLVPWALLDTVIGFNVLLHPDPHWGSLDGIPPKRVGAWWAVWSCWSLAVCSPEPCPYPPLWRATGNHCRFAFC